jgi:hypothetical protein
MHNVDDWRNWVMTAVATLFATGAVAVAATPI